MERAAGPGDLEAVDLLTRAAEQTAPAAPTTAAGWYETAARLLPDAPEHDPRRVALLTGQGLALAAAGRPGEARDVLRRVLGMLPDGFHEVRTVLQSVRLHDTLTFTSTPGRSSASTARSGMSSVRRARAGSAIVAERGSISAPSPASISR